MKADGQRDLIRKYADRANQMARYPRATFARLAKFGINVTKVAKKKD